MQLTGGVIGTYTAATPNDTVHGGVAQLVRAAES